MKLIGPVAIAGAAVRDVSVASRTVGSESAVDAEVVEIHVAALLPSMTSPTAATP